MHKHDKLPKRKTERLGGEGVEREMCECTPSPKDTDRASEIDRKGGGHRREKINTLKCQRVK